MIFFFIHVPVSYTHLEESIEPLLIGMELKNITCTIQCATDIHFTVDRNWIKEAIVNIVKNCMEHTSENGHICISCKNTPLYTFLVIEDDGCGIATCDLAHIFERFYKGENAGQDSVGTVSYTHLDVYKRQQLQELRSHQNQLSVQLKKCVRLWATRR